LTVGKQRNVETSKRQNVETSKRQNVETSKHQTVQTSKRPNVETEKCGGGVDERPLVRARFVPRGVFLLAPFLCALTMMSSGCASRRDGWGAASRGDRSIRAIWVTRWDYKTPSDIARIMDNCRAGGFNTVLFQVRGAGTVFYRSRIEPWADELGGRDPGFDPLAVACREAHRRGMALHAWVNVTPGYRGKQSPVNPDQLYHRHPDWFLRDDRGRRQPLGWYQSLNPCYPEVRRYLVAVMREIVEGYPIDGLHMDYIRFVNEHSPAYPPGARVPDYPRDRRTLAMFRRATGSTPDRAPRQWTQWRTAQVTQLVRDTRIMLRRVKSRVKLSAAVGASPQRAVKEHFQDAQTWIAEGLVDAVFPMNYADNMEEFNRRQAKWSARRPPVPVVTGIMFDKRSPRLVSQQIAQVSRTGGHFAAFAYNSLFERLEASGRAARDEQSASRSDLRRVIIPQIKRGASRALARR
jgi:uncharacterized lipoprotein YddW (UPF0748 family)